MTLSVSEYAAVDAVGLAALIKNGDVSAREVELVARNAILVSEQKLNGLSYELLDEALSYDASGPLGGVPYLIKDEGPHASGVKWSAGSKYFEGSIAANSTEQILRARRGGLAILGTTTTPEFSMSFVTESRRRGITTNPWDVARSPGGSSGGAAAFVAAGAVPIAHATDGLGSIRIPASFCGLVGLKPSRGRTPCGVDGFAGNGYDFVLTRTVRDTAMALDIISGPAHDSKYRIPRRAEPYSDLLQQKATPLRIGYDASAWTGAAVSSSAVAAIEKTADLLRQLGHSVTPITLSFDRKRMISAFRVACATLFASLFVEGEYPTEDTVEAVSLAGWREAMQMNGRDFAQGGLDFDFLVHNIANNFAEIDILMTPTSPQVAPLHGALNYDSPQASLDDWLNQMLSIGLFTAPFNIGGQPAISLPLHNDHAGLPVGVQFVAASGRDDLLIRLAGQLESSMPWAHRRPSVHAAEL